MILTAKSPKFTIVMTVFETYELLKRAGQSVIWQSNPSWELLVIADGPSSKEQEFAQSTIRQLILNRPENRIELHSLNLAPGCHGNVARNHALNLARGEYICWVNHDNLIHPEYLASHQYNFDQNPNCLSVVDIDLWIGNRYHGIYPRAFQRSKVDLLCFSMPTRTAKQINAFGGTASNVYAADWIAFDAAHKKLPILHQQKTVGVHF